MSLPNHVRFLALSVLLLGGFILLLTTAAGAQTNGDPTDAVKRGTVSICKEINDDWKCIGQSDQWTANTPFNVLFENTVPVGVEFIGIIFYKQGAGGKDVEFVGEYQQNIGEKNRKYATLGDQLKLPVGTYSVYIITWGKRELTVHNGNFTDFLSKTVLTVK